MRATHVLLVSLLLLGSARCQVQDGYVWSYHLKTGAGFNAPGGGASTYTNNASTGTVCNELVKQDTLGNAIVTTGGETLGVIGVATAGCGTTGAVIVFFAGDVPIKFDTASPTVSDYVGISSASGFVTDVGSNPGSGQNIGQVRPNPFTGAAPSNCNSGIGCYVHLGIGSSGGGGTGSCSGSCFLLSPGGSQTVNQPPGSTLTFNSPSNPVIINAAGQINGVGVPDSGTAAQTVGSDNTAGFFSGAAPASDTCYTGGNIFQPLFSAKVSGVNYSTQLEEQCDKDQLGGYPSLDPVLGLIPINEVVADTSNCNSSTVIKGDQSGCASGASSTHWNQILVTGTETGPNTGTMKVANTLVFDGAGGHINADLLNFANWPSAAVGGPFNAVNAVPVVNAATTGGSTIGASVVPNCIGPGCALGFNQTTHQFTAQNIALNAAHPMILLPCNGTNSQCPNSSTVTGISAAAILYSFTLAANQLSVDGQCFHVQEFWKHTTGSAASSYSWNVGGTGAVGSAPTGGTTTATVSNTGGALFFDTLHVCRVSGALTTYINAEQWQLGTASGGPSSTNAAIDWTQAVQVNLLFNVANTDADTFFGGEVYYP